MIVVVAVVLVLCLVIAYRRRRRALLAGRDSDRPIYSVEPPSRSVRRRRTEQL